MTREELFDALDGLMAYDHGATDSGIHDERLRATVVAQLRVMPPIERHETVRDFVWHYRLEDGYTPEDWIATLGWLYNDLGIEG